MKKMICFLLTVMLSVSVCCFLSACGKPTSSPIEDFTYELQDGEATITGYNGTDLEIVVPDSIEGRPVRYIGYNKEEKKGAFEGYDMTSIIIPEGVKLISEYAFKECKMLERITLPDSLQRFYYSDSYNLASGISSLEDTKWYQNQPDGVLYINNVLIGVKGDKSGITEIEIKNGTKTILGEAFRNQDNLTNVIIPNSVNYIGTYAFHDCDLLKELNVPDGVVVGKDIFDGKINGNIVQETTER